MDDKRNIHRTPGMMPGALSFPGRSPQLVLGVVIIVLGVLFTLDNLGLLDASYYLRLWPVLLIGVGVIKLSQPEGGAARFIGSIIAVVGVLLLLRNLHVLRFSLWNLFWPLVLVFLGIALIWQVIGGRGSVHANGDSTVSAVAVMSGIKRSCVAKDFHGGELVAIMGGCDIDLREAVMQADEATIQVLAFWGGMEIKVPENWSVSVEGLPFMGGFDDRTRPPGGEFPAKILHIRGLAVMGGVGLRN